MKSRKSYYRYSGLKLDCAMGTCAVATIVATVLLFTNFNDNKKLCPVIFGFAAFMNLIRAIKFFKRKEKKKYIVASIETLLLIGVCVFCVFIII